MRDFYRPRYHWELVEYFKKRYGKDHPADFQEWTYSRLYAAYMRLRREEEETSFVGK